MAIAALAALLTSATVRAQEIVTLAARDDATISFLLTAPGTDKPAAAAILFPGGPGHIRLRTEDGRIRLGEGNFLVRTRHLFVARGLVTAVVDTPSDQPLGMDDGFRLGGKHAEDIRHVVVELRRRYPGIAIFLVGTSRGTVSAASVGRALASDIAGVVLTATLFRGGRRGSGLSGFDYSALTSRVLLAHHAEDACSFTPYADARALAQSRRYPLITVRGGKPATSGPCEAFSAHGFLGKEPATVDAIVDWMLNKPHAVDID